jgi:hypothetical protein
MEFNIDLGTQTFRGPAPVPVGPLYASVDGRVSRLGNDEIVFFDPRSGRSHVMTEQVLRALDLCRELRPLADHVGRVAAGIPGLQGQNEAVRRVLEGLVKSGLLVSHEDLLQQFAAAAPLQPAPFFGVCIRACDRPEQLRALLASLLDYERRHRPGHRYLVLDDSRQPEAARRHQDLVREFAEAAGVRAHCLGREAWDGIVDDLVREVPGGERLRPLLQRSSQDARPRGGGIGKNLITLLTAGQRYALLDDDFVFPLRRHPEFLPGLYFAGGVAPRTYASREQALAAGAEFEADPIAQQLALCGQNLGSISRSGGELALERTQLAGLNLGRTATLRPEARVAMTVNGHRGSAGASGVAWLFALNAQARAGMVENRDTYLAGLKDPPVWFGARVWRAVPGNNFTPFLVDNAALMPCTSPFGRSEDALFAGLAALARTDAVVLESPYAIAHLQESGRERLEAMKRPETPDLNLCLAEFARQVAGDVHALDPARRLGGFCARLRDLADADEGGIANHLREYLAYLRSNIVQALQGSLAQAKDAPIHWAADLRSVVETNGRAILDRGAPRFAGWSEDMDEAACAARFREEAQVLADGLERWPQAFDAAARLGKRWESRF